jgi:hypothetical protein
MTPHPMFHNRSALLFFFSSNYAHTVYATQTWEWQLQRTFSVPVMWQVSQSTNTDFFSLNAPSCSFLFISCDTYKLVLLWILFKFQHQKKILKIWINGLSCYWKTSFVSGKPQNYVSNNLNHLYFIPLYKNL